MFKSLTRSLGLATVLTVAGLHANATAISSPIDLAKRQEILSQKVIIAYAQRKDVSQVIHRLEEQQNRLKNSIHDPEISNLLDFLQLCLENIKTISAKPRTLDNSQMIADLGTSIGEGSRYIVQTLQ